MKRIKILRIFSRLNIGGPSIHTILLTAGLNNDSFTSILVKGSEDKHEGNMLYLADRKGIKPIIIPEMGRSISILKDLKAFVNLYQLIKKEKPDIVHTHTAKAGALGRTAAILIRNQGRSSRTLKKLLFHKNLQHESQNSKLKIVHTFHGNIFKGYFNPIISKIFLLIERVLARFTDIIITVSKEQKKEILNFGIGDKDKVITIPLGLELERFLDLKRFKGRLRAELKIAEDIKLIGIIGRLVPIKNHKMFIDAVSKLKERNSELKVKFLIIGDGELKKELMNYVGEKELEKDVIFLGFRKDMEIIYADLDIVVLTSLNEGLPVALIEAMASGKAVISTKVGGVIDLFEKTDDIEYEEKDAEKDYEVINCGILIKSGDREGLSLAIKELIENDSLRERMGEEGKKIVYPKYDISRLIDDMKSLYEGIVYKKVQV